MNIFKTLVISYIFGILLFLFTGCSITPSDISGTGSQAGNGIILGTVLYEDGTPVISAEVFIRPSDFIKDTSELSRKRQPDTFTDDSGVFSLEHIGPGNYHIEINDNYKNALLLQLQRDIDDRENVIIDKSVIKPTASLSGRVNMEYIRQSVKLYEQIYGLDYIQRINDSGYFRFPSIPSGSLRFRIISEDTSMGIIETKTVDLKPGEANDTLSLYFPFTFWKDTAVVRYILDTNSLGNISVSSVISEVKKGRITRLNFNGKGLSCIPAKIGELKLTHLNLGNNYLSRLPKEFMKLSFLENLDLMRNKFRELDRSIFSLLNLKHLDISENNMRILSRDIGKLASLRSLKLDNNRIEHLSSKKGKDVCQLSKLVNLEILDLSNNIIYNIPKEMTDLKNLKELYVSHNRLVNVSPEVKQWLDTYSTDEGKWEESQDSTFMDQPVDKEMNNKPDQRPVMVR
jgi:hypothetical protein